MTKLVGLQFKFQFKKGVDNKPADALSRVGHVFFSPSDLYGLASLVSGNS
jgi:hypothetical protein